MLLIVFGAGASYDSSYDFKPGESAHEEYRLPLAQQLFENRTLFSVVLNIFGECKPIIPLLRESSRHNQIESILQRIQTDSSSDNVKLNQLCAIKYYLQSVIESCEIEWEGRTNGITNYLSLSDQVRRVMKKKKVMMVTFNYDTLLEKALAGINGINIKFQGINDYIFKDELKLFKVHGSVNWGRRIESMPRNPSFPSNDHTIGISRIINNISLIKVTDQYQVMKHRPTYYEDGLPYFPAIAIPVEDKNVFECPLEHLQELEKSLPEVDTVVCIGWRANEFHFLNLLKKSVNKPLRIYAVSGNREASDGTLTNIKKHLGDDFNHIYNPYPKGFTSFAVGEVLESYL